MCKKELYIAGAAIVMAVAMVMFFPDMGTAATYDLSLIMTGTGKGTVTFSSGDQCSDTCKLEFISPYNVTLSAAAPPGGTFNGWTGCDSANGTTCYVTMNSAKSIGADFTGPYLVPGSVSGKITDSFGSGVNNARAVLQLQGNNWGYGSAITDASGNYSFSYMAPGTYTLRFLNPPVPFGSGTVFTNNQWFDGKHSLATADLLIISQGSSTVINVQYPQVGAVFGTVKDVNNNGLAGIRVFAFDLDEQSRGTTATDSNGDYLLQNLPTGTYKIYFIANRLAPPGMNPQNFMTQTAYVTVTAPYSVTGINATLSPGRTISGRVTDTDGNPIAAAGVHVIDSTGRNISGIATDSTGDYTALGIPPGNYKVLFMPYFQSSPAAIDVTQLYSRAFYGGSADYNIATVVTVPADADVTIIDGVLEVTGPAVLSSWSAVGAVVFKWDFNVEVVGMTSYRSILISNAGTADLKILGALTRTGDDAFSIQYDRCSNATLPPFKTCTFAVAFAPQSEGTKTGAINIPSNDPNVPNYIIGLTGSGGAATGNSGYTGVPYSPYSSVTVTPVPQVNLTFSTVYAPGEATVTAITSLSTPTLSNFRMLNGASYDITTTASYSPPVTICITYDPTTMSNPANEPNLRLFHFEVINSKWRDITILPVNTITHTICGITSSLSPFVVAEPNNVFSGFFSPVENYPILNSAKAGQAIPVKWRITDPNGVPISDPASFASLTSSGINCGNLSGNTESAVEEYSSGDSGLQYSGDGYWQFNWKTPKTYAGQCRSMVLTLGDGSMHDAVFKFK